MRLLSICVNGLYSDGYTYHENLLPKYQARIGYDVYVLASMYSYDNKGGIIRSNKTYYDDDNGLHIRRLDIVGNKDITYRFKRFKGFYKAIEEVQPDIIFCHLFQFLDVREVIKYKKQHPVVKVFFDSHADTINSAHGFLSRKVLHGIVWKWYARRAYRACERFYGVSPARVKFLRDIYGLPEQKTALLTMGADDDMVQYAKEERNIIKTQKKYNISREERLIVTGGKIDLSKKEVLNLMRAVNEIEDKTIRLIVFGSVANELKDEMKGLETDRVKYIGWLNEEEAYSLFAISWLVVFPSTHSVYWEQVAGQGIPMLIRRWSGFEHLDLGCNIKYLYSGSKAEIHSAICNVMNNKTYEKMKKNAEEKGKSRFSYLNLAKESIVD